MKKFTEMLKEYNQHNLKALSSILSEEPTEEQFNKEVDTAKKQHEGKIRKKISAAATQAVEIQKEDTDLIEQALAEEQLDEVLSKDASAKEFIDDFIKSDDPRFAGDSKAKRIQRALAAYYKNNPEKSKLRQEEVEQLDELSKKTLSSYKEKSLSNYKELVDQGLKTKSSDPNYEKIRRKAGNRIAGSFDAAARLGKMKNEEVESIEEGWNAQGHKSSDGERWLRKMGFERVGGSKHPKWQHKETGETVPGWGDHGKEIKPEAARTTRNLVMSHHQKHGLPYKDL